MSTSSIAISSSNWMKLSMAALEERKDLSWAEDEGLVDDDTSLLRVHTPLSRRGDRPVTTPTISHSRQYHHHTCLTALFPGLPGWAGTRKVKPIWILPKQETVSGSDISWAICKSAPRSRQITMPAPHHSVFYRPDALRATQTASKHWRPLVAVILQYLFRLTAAPYWSKRQWVAVASDGHCLLLQ